MDSAVREIEESQRKERRQIREDAELLNDLMRHKGWKRYTSLVEVIAQNYYLTVMKPVENVLESIRPEFAKGVLSGLSLASQLPNMKIREAHELRSEDLE